MNDTFKASPLSFSVVDCEFDENWEYEKWRMMAGIDMKYKPLTKREYKRYMIKIENSIKLSILVFPNKSVCSSVWPEFLKTFRFVSIPVLPAV